MKTIKSAILIFFSIILLTSSAFAFNDISDHWAKDYINSLNDKNIVSGYKDGDFKPNRNISREEAASLICRLVGNKSTEGKYIFTDIEENRWSAKYIAYLYDNGIIAGYKDNTFKPENSITRAEYARIIYTVLDSKGELYNLKKSFSDIKDSWASENIQYLSGNNLVRGYSNGTFRPEDSITRGEACTLAYNLLLFREDPLKMVMSSDKTEPKDGPAALPFDPKISDDIIVIK